MLQQQRNEAFWCRAHEEQEKAGGSMAPATARHLRAHIAHIIAAVVHQGQAGNHGEGRGGGAMGCAAPWWTRTAQDGAGQGWAGWLAGCWLAGWCSGSGGGSGGESEGQLFSEARFLRPRSPLGCATPMDISFELVEGDFAVRRWRRPVACCPMLSRLHASGTAGMLGLVLGHAAPCRAAQACMLVGDS